MPTVLRSYGVLRESGLAHASRFVQYLRRSRALASLLPALLASGVLTLAATAILRETHPGFSLLFGSGWLETWLTCWAFAYPATYLAASLLRYSGTEHATPGPQSALRNR
jgi:hypothetical protein